MANLALVKKLWLRVDGTADSKAVEFVSEAGTRWQVEFCLHSGTSPQSPRLLVMFRNRSNPMEPQRYTLAPPGVSRIPREAVRELSESDLVDLLGRSVKV